MSYHHGRLREELLAAAASTVAAKGSADLNLRQLAREIGVSHAAPRHHFGDKRGVLTALAAEGYRLLTAQVADASDFLEAGVAYVQFAIEHPGHFPVMFRPGLVDENDPDLVAASEALRATLIAGAATLPRGSGSGAGHSWRDELPPMALAAWSAAHGFATLAINDNFAVDDEARRGESLTALARETLRLLGGP
ncbi:MAG TPA: TetR/AcrR family transcriptional regulator [Trueperaceae bacterium]|nr:TetR/AcrR family transcriptional regulator [Trueperaceae bacterium]